MYSFILQLKKKREKKEENKYGAKRKRGGVRIIYLFFVVNLSGGCMYHSTT